MSSRQQNRKRFNAENKDPQRRKKENAKGGSKNRKKTVSDLVDKEYNINKATHDKADKEAQVPAKTVLEEHSGPPADGHHNEISQRRGRGRGG